MAVMDLYGYTYNVAVSPGTGRPVNDFQPMIDALVEKYKDGLKPKNIGVHNALIINWTKYKILRSSISLLLLITILYIDIPIRINRIVQTIGNNIPGGDKGGLIIFL